MASDPWMDFLRAGERVAQAYLSSRPLRFAKLYFDNRGHVVDAELHPDLGEVPALGDDARAVPVPVLSRSKDKELLDRCVDVVNQSPGRLLIPDLAERVGRARGSGSFRQQVNRWIDEGEMGQDDDGRLLPPA